MMARVKNSITSGFEVKVDCCLFSAELDYFFTGDLMIKFCGIKYYKLAGKTRDFSLQIK